MPLCRPSARVPHLPVAQYLFFLSLYLPQEADISSNLETNIRWAEAFILIYSVTDKCSFDECNRLKFLINYNKRRRKLSSNHKVSVHLLSPFSVAVAGTASHTTRATANNSAAALPTLCVVDLIAHSSRVKRQNDDELSPAFIARTREIYLPPAIYHSRCELTIQHGCGPGVE